MTWYCSKCGLSYYEAAPPLKCTRCLNSQFHNELTPPSQARPEIVSQVEPKLDAEIHEPSSTQIRMERDTLRARVTHLEQILDRIAMVFEDIRG